MVSAPGDNVAPDDLPLKGKEGPFSRVSFSWLFPDGEWGRAGGMISFSGHCKITCVHKGPTLTIAT